MMLIPARFFIVSPASSFSVIKDDQVLRFVGF